MTTQVPAATDPDPSRCSVERTPMKMELLAGDGDDEDTIEDGEDGEDEEDDEEAECPVGVMRAEEVGRVNEDGELFDYIYGSESNDHYVMGE